MSRLPRYCEIINKYRSRVDEYLETSYGNRRHKRIRDNLLKSLADTLMLGKLPHDEIPDKKTKSILRKLERQLAADDYRISKAWYENRIYGASRGSASFRWHVRPVEIKYVEQLWADLHYSREDYRKSLRRHRADWLSDVDELHEDVVIWLDDRAIEDIVLVALEAYAVPKRGVRFTETYGMCFGSIKSTEKERQAHGRHTTHYVYISSVHIQLRAEGFSNKITYDLRSLDTQMAVAKHLFPQLDIVGDFHTHPYRSVDELREAKGWRYSRGDEACIPAWVSPLTDMGYHPRTSLIVGIGKGGKRISRPGKLKPNVIRFSINKYHFYLAAYRIVGNRYTESNIAINAISLPGM
jgi:hypothetical protein